MAKNPPRRKIKLSYRYRVDESGAVSGVRFGPRGEEPARKGTGNKRTALVPMAMCPICAQELPRNQLLEHQAQAHPSIDSQLEQPKPKPSPRAAPTRPIRPRLAIPKPRSKTDTTAEPPPTSRPTPIRSRPATASPTAAPMQRCPLCRNGVRKLERHLRRRHNLTPGVVAEVIQTGVLPKLQEAGQKQRPTDSPAATPPAVLQAVNESPGHWPRFRDALVQSIGRIGEKYFSVERYRAVGPEQTPRERVYCYELYHQLRCELGDDFPFTLHGEIDKSGQAFIEQKLGGRGLAAPNPDFVLHIPGSIADGDQLAVIEVKRIGLLNARAFQRDIDKLEAFITPIGYHHAVFLLFGFASCSEVENVVKGLAISSPKVHVLWHHQPGRPPVILRGAETW
jgi:hypothetical protein